MNYAIKILRKDRQQIGSRKKIDWQIGKERRVVWKGKLCNAGVIHVYDNVISALLQMNIHLNIKSINDVEIYLCEWRGKTICDDFIKRGVERCTLLKDISKDIQSVVSDKVIDEMRNKTFLLFSGIEKARIRYFSEITRLFTLEDKQFVFEQYLESEYYLIPTLDVICYNYKLERERKVNV